MLRFWQRFALFSGILGALLAVSPDARAAPSDQPYPVGELASTMGGAAVAITHDGTAPRPASAASPRRGFRPHSSESLIDLASRQGPRSENGWQAIPVLNGDAIRIWGTGTVTFSAGFPRSLYEHTVGPEGRASVERGSWSHPLEQCEKMNDHALVAFLAGPPIFIGAKKYENPKVEQSGQLLLGVNDIDVSNSSGSFNVTVEVNPDDLIKQRHPSPAYQAPSWGQ